MKREHDELLDNNNNDNKEDNDDDDDDDDDDNSSEEGGEEGDTKEVTGEEDLTTTTTATTMTNNDDHVRYERLEKLKRQKRLAMNRECARNRRRRKKLRMELLDKQVQDLTNRNTLLDHENRLLGARVQQLELELNRAKSWHTLRLGGGGGGAADMAGLSAMNLNGMAGGNMMNSMGMMTGMNMNMNLNMGAGAGMAGFGAGFANMGSIANMAAAAGLSDAGIKEALDAPGNCVYANGGDVPPDMNSAKGALTQSEKLKYLQMMHAAGGGNAGGAF